MTRLALTAAVALALFQLGDALTTAFALQAVPGAYEENALAGAVMAYLGFWPATLAIKGPIVLCAFLLARAGTFGLVAILGGLIVSVPILVNNLAVILA